MFQTEMNLIMLSNYPQNAKGQVEVAIVVALNDFHVSNVNIDLALGEEMDVKASQTVNSSSLRVEQVLAIHDLGYVSTKQHGDYVLKMNMGIKQDCMPLMPLEPH
jgi:hypothetical protein